ncbi:MAG TPA: asparagine synthase (glutamine-hydrolyzing) [Pyrinomonadaceae bacterium]|jgi:asparagine synthase (glutamine-hydrolysing)|nr:asparagine synthase (glutamine-hydrolyzing) [Pyrinomonadaceae bacterium]
MCGIAGLIGATDRRAATASVERMTCALARRGPDGEGVESWSEAVLGHRRLAIFDLSEAGSQPMLSPDASVGIVFNGAIYNFRELRAELAARGYEFKSHTDTEVLIHGYREWGIDALVSKIRGMYAFGLWDERRRKLFLVRDRLGVKPLVYAVRGKELAFASHVRALGAGGFVAEIDEQAVTEYLEFGFVTDGRSIYRGAQKVAAASIVEWSDGELSTRNYWSPPVALARGGPTFEEAVEETERLFLRAVETRLFADVPVGALLSGGVDSGLVCWAIARLGGDVTAYTVGTPGDPWDETVDARATAQRLGIRHRVLELSAQGAPDLSELISAYAEPFACASALGMLGVSRAVAAEATVLLTGDGGDDVFLGYPEHRHFWLAEKLARRLPGAAARGWLASRDRVPRAGALRRAASFLDYTTGGLGAVTSAHDGLPFYQAQGLLGERLAGASLEQRALAWSHASGRHVLSEFLEYDRRMRFVGEYLVKVDRATMHYALEARSPFLDQELWEFAAALPFDLRLRRARLKAVLRELARRHLGERVARGRKRGFGVPVQRWIAGGRWRTALEESMRDSVLEREGWIRSAPVLAQLEAASRKGWAPKQLWYIFVLESWLRAERSRAANTASALEDSGPVARAAEAEHATALADADAPPSKRLGKENEQPTVL